MNEQIKLLDSALLLEGQIPTTDAFDYSASQITTGVDAAVPAAEVGNKLITTINLTIDTCRWPFGDPAEPGFHYCGELPLVSGPYCDKHNSKAYQPMRKKGAAPIKTLEKTLIG